MDFNDGNDDWVQQQRDREDDYFQEDEEEDGSDEGAMRVDGEEQAAAGWGPEGRREREREALRARALAALSG